MELECRTSADVEAYLDYVRTQPLLRTDFDVAHTFFERHAARPSLVFEAARWMSCDGQAWVPDDEEWPTRGLTVAAVLQALPDLTQPADRVEAALWLVNEQPSLGETTTPVWDNIISDLKVLADSQDPRQRHDVISRTAHRIFNLTEDSDVRRTMAEVVYTSLSNLVLTDPDKGVSVALQLREATPRTGKGMFSALEWPSLGGLKALAQDNMGAALKAAQKFCHIVKDATQYEDFIARLLPLVVAVDPFAGMREAEDLFGIAKLASARIAALQHGVAGMVRLLPEDVGLNSAFAWTTRAMAADVDCNAVGLDAMKETLREMAKNVPVNGGRAGIRLHRMAAEAPRKIRPDLRKLAVQSVVLGCEGLAAASNGGGALVSGLEWLAQHCGRPTGRSAVSAFRDVLAQADSGSVAAVFSGGGRLADSIVTEVLRHRLRNTLNPAAAFEAILTRGSAPLVTRTIGRTPRQRKETFQKIFGHT